MNWCSAAVSISEQLPEDGLVRPKHVATKCDFSDIYKINDRLNGLCCFREGNERTIRQRRFSGIFISLILFLSTLNELHGTPLGILFIIL
jgi:hypothetical protein